MASLLARLIAAARPAPVALIQQRGDEGPDAYAGMVGTGYPVAPEVNLAEAMRTVARFPWVWACVEAITSDLAGLPLYVERPMPDGKTKAVDHPEFFALLSKPVPSGRASSIQQRRQWIADYILTRVAYWWLDQPQSPAVLRRIHPDHVEGSVDAMGLPTMWHVGSSVVERVPVERIIQARGISWSPDTDATLYATTPIQAIASLLATEQAVMDGMRRSSKLLRPDAVLTPPEGVDWKPEQANKIGQWLREWMTSKGGTLVLPWHAELKTLGHSPKDMDFIAGLDRITKATLAVFRVPPSRVMEGSANFATAQQEAILYWEARIAEAAVLDDAMSQLARRWPGFNGVVVRTDFSGVSALQAGKEAQLRRVGMHILNGMSAADAYEVEGLVYEAGKMGAAPAVQQPAEEPARAALDLSVARADRHLRAALERLDAAPAEGLSPDDARAIATTIRAAKAAQARAS